MRTSQLQADQLLGTQSPLNPAICPLLSFYPLLPSSSPSGSAGQAAQGPGGSRCARVPSSVLPLTAQPPPPQVLLGKRLRAQAEAAALESRIIALTANLERCEATGDR